MEGNWNLAAAKWNFLDCISEFGRHNRQRCFNALEGNQNLAEDKPKLLGVTIGKGALLLWNVAGTLQRPTEAFGCHNRQRRFNALEGNWTLAEAKWKLLGVTIGKDALMLWKVTGASRGQTDLLGVTIGKGTLMLWKVTRTLQRPNGSFWESQ